VLWERDHPIDRVGSPKIGELTFRHRGNRTGDHRPDSVFLAKGPGVSRGRVEGVSILDFATTVGSLLGVPLPDTDGAPIAALGVSASERDERIRA
jgi:predicted AlkP superfamily phosphohydrolase/phosphomutase